MDISDLRKLVESLDFVDEPISVVTSHRVGGRILDVALTERLRSRCRRGRIWNSRGFLVTLKNAAYGFDPARGLSPGGKDGIFRLTRTHRPANAMMKKIFAGFLDRPDGDALAIASKLGCDIDQLVPVRLVSHHMRLLGVHHGGSDRDVLVLVDYDDTDPP